MHSIFSPHISSLQENHPDFVEYMALFMRHWIDRRPVIVRGVRGQLSWSPEALFEKIQEPILVQEDGPSGQRTAVMGACNFIKHYNGQFVSASHWRRARSKQASNKNKNYEYKVRD
jgi:hypothetical protein